MKSSLNQPIRIEKALPAEVDSAVPARKTLCTWSAMPTPLTPGNEVDRESLRRSLIRHDELGCEGVMLAGTCGEGPWLRNVDLGEIVRAGVEHSPDALKVAVQVTDNAPKQILDRLDSVARGGVQYGVIAQPYFLLNSTPARILKFYHEVFDRSPIPIIFYDRGTAAGVPVPIEILEEIVSHRQVIMVKDSSCSASRYSAMSVVRSRRPELRILTGNEFDLLASLKAGCDGAFFGGMILTGLAVRRCFELFQAGEEELAGLQDAEVKKLLIDVYGGPEYGCWLSGLKYALVCLRVFSYWSSVLEYPLTEDCRKAIETAVERLSWLHP